MDTWEDDKPDGEEGEEGVDGWQVVNRSATIFLIDAVREMFDDPEDAEEDPPFTRAIKAVHATLMRKAISSTHDQVGVVFFNTREAKNKLDYTGVYVFQDLQRPCAENILAMEKLIKMHPAQFDSQYGQTDKASIHDALRTCQTVFLDCDKRQLGRSILLFTCRDDPHSQNEQVRRQAVAKAKDLKESRIALEILHMGAAFDVNKFYKDLLFDELDDGESETTREQRILADPTTRLSQLMERVTRLENKQRPSATVQFTLAPGVEMTVGLYTVVRSAVKPKKLKLWKNTNEEVKSVTKQFLEETGGLLLPSDLACYQIYGDKEIIFTPEETRSMVNVYEPGIVLLGFKPMSFLKTELFFKSPSFIYPKEKDASGSTKLFTALLERCLARQVLALVRCVPRAHSSAIFAALIPQAEVLDETNAQVQPPGFLLHPLPYADYISKMTLEKRTVASDEQIEACKKVVKKLRGEYHPEDVDDPSAETHWEVIKALALNRQRIEDVPDQTVPDVENIEKVAGPSLKEFERMVYPPSYDPLAKLPTASTRPSSGVKKEKVDPSTMDVEAMLKKGKGNSLTVPVLKAWLIKRRVVVTAKKKAELLQDAMDLLE